MGRRKGKEGERRRRGKENAGRGKGKGREEKGREKKEKKRGRERERWYPTFWYKVTPMSAREIHARRIGLATRNQSIKE